MIIESTSNSTIKELAKLAHKKDRDAKNMFLVEGEHLLQEAKEAGVLLRVFQRSDLEQFDFADVTLCSQAVLNKLSSQKSDAKYIGLCKMNKNKADSADSVPFGQRILILDHIQIPGNMGTLIRSACSFGIDQIIYSSDCADPYGPKTIQSTQGALFHVPLLEADLLKVIPTLKQSLPVFGAALHHDSIELHDLEIPKQFAIIIGNEGQGIRQDVLNLCSNLVHIEMQSFESLNASIAGSILMYTFQFPGKSSSI